MSVLVEKHTIVHTRSGVTYRLRPNPDAEGGFRSGAFLDWTKDGSWNGHFYIAPEALEALGLSLLEAAKETKNG